MVWWKMSLLMAGGLEPDGLQGPFQPKPFYDSMILNGIEYFRSCGTEESPTPRRASPRLLSCLETPSCSQLAPSASLLTPNLQAVSRLCPVTFSVSHKCQIQSSLVCFGCWLCRSWGSPRSSCPHWAGSMHPAATWRFPVPEALRYASNFK